MTFARTSQIAIIAIVISGLFPLISFGDEKIKATETDEAISIETDALSAVIAKKGYVSGIKAGTFIDKKTGAKDLGFGLHIQDWLMAPGWRDDGYQRDPKLHGKLPKHIVEGPQLCTQAKQLPAELIRGDGFVAVQLKYTYTQAGAGYKPGSTWVQTLVFQPGVRYVVSAERITSANTVDDLFYRLDMPGHIRHKNGDTFTQVYLSYLDQMIPASAFATDFGPDEKFFYQRKPDAIPTRMIRAYQVKLNGKPGPWLAGMTLAPEEVAEAWCHQRGYVCFIEELHRRHVNAGESFGAAYIVGWFDDVPEMQKVYDQHHGATRIEIGNGKFKLAAE
ncbi:MAG TPA: hypothetical protein VFE47_01745 [Tepidisphaeraceae bacterium]|jgi:hypothetical protein|nr:hypothetical protein [Tepidisphaeraceae bacterium]